MPPNPAPIIEILMNSPKVKYRSGCCVASPKRSEGDSLTYKFSADYKPALLVLIFYSLLEHFGKKFEPAPLLTNDIDHCQVLQPARFTVWIFRKLFKDFNGFIVCAPRL